MVGRLKGSSSKKYKKNNLKAFLHIDKKQFITWFLVAVLVVARIAIYYKNRVIYPDGTVLKISGRVSGEPLQYSYYQRVFLQGFKVYIPRDIEIKYGDRLVVTGYFEGGAVKSAEVVEKKDAGNFLYNFRENLLDFYQTALPRDHSALVAGVTIGSKKNITSEFWEKLKTSGTAHVVVASGMNVTLVASFLMSFLVSLVPRRKAIPLALLGIWAYSLISGFDSPVIRAAIMGSITFTAQELGKLYFAWRALIFSALTMLFIKPEWIADTGFILSFAATTSLMLFEKRVHVLLKFIKFGFLRKDLSTTLAAQIGVTPILFFSFGQLNLLSPLINASVLWTILPITIIGMTGGILGLIAKPIGSTLILLVYPLTSWFIFVVNLLG